MATTEQVRQAVQRVPRCLQSFANLFRTLGMGGGRSSEVMIQKGIDHVASSIAESRMAIAQWDESPTYFLPITNEQRLAMGANPELEAVPPQLRAKIERFKASWSQVKQDLEAAIRAAASSSQDNELVKATKASVESAFRPLVAWLDGQRRSAESAVTDLENYKRQLTRMKEDQLLREQERNKQNIEKQKPIIAEIERLCRRLRNLDRGVSYSGQGSDMKKVDKQIDRQFEKLKKLGVAKEEWKRLTKLHYDASW
jgi:hypothetical protein